MRLNVLLAIVFLLLILANVYVRPDSARLNFEFLPEMVRTPSYKAFDENEVFSNGLTFQAPPPHAVARGMALLPVTHNPADAQRAGDLLTNRYSADDLAVYTRGSEVFRTWCTPCHGGGGKGDGPVAMRGFPAPPPLTSQTSIAMKDGQMFHLISYGQNNMPGYASQISPEDRWKAVVYVRSLQRRVTSATPEDAPRMATVGASSVAANAEAIPASSGQEARP
jgi:mono/diheme cytochrome c family protein